MDLFKNKNILVIGDVMIDSYLFGNVERISPEAPVPIVDITHKENKLGGAANVAANIKNLGGTPLLCSIIGDDQDGNIFLDLLKKLDISSKYIYKISNRITTNKTRVVGNNHQMIRIDNEIKSELNSTDSIHILDLVKKIFNDHKIDCILIEDYDKGLLNEIIIYQIILRAKYLKIPIIVDPKKKNFHYYKDITLFKPNLKELKEGLNLSNPNINELLESGASILHNKGIEIVFITLSENGIFVSYNKDNKIINKIIPSTPREVVDVSGAGDCVIAVVSMLLYDLDIEEIAKISNIAGGIACEEVGVIPIEKEKLLKEYDYTNQKRN